MSRQRLSDQKSPRGHQLYQKRRYAIDVLRLFDFPKNLLPSSYVGIIRCNDFERITTTALMAEILCKGIIPPCPELFLPGGTLLADVTVALVFNAFKLL